MKRQLVERALTSEGPVRTGTAQGAHRSVTVNLGESPLAWLHARGHIDRRLFEAGEALRERLRARAIERKCYDALGSGSA